MLLLSPQYINIVSISHHVAVYMSPILSTHHARSSHTRIHPNLLRLSSKLNLMRRTSSATTRTKDSITPRHTRLISQPPSLTLTFSSKHNPARSKSTMWLFKKRHHNVHSYHVCQNDITTTRVNHHRSNWVPSYPTRHLVHQIPAMRKISEEDSDIAMSRFAVVKSQQRYLRAS